MTLGGRGATIFCLLIAAGLSGGCAAAIYPPANLVDPVPVYFAQYNVHSTILMPENGKYVDYSFGDWNYAALQHKCVNDALFALTISGASALERRELNIDPHTDEPVLHDNPDLVIRMYADRAAVKRRLAVLRARFDEDVRLHHDGGMVVYANSDVYVKDQQHYSLGNNCNHMTAETLRALGFRVDGPIITNQFHICRPQELPSAQ